MNVTPAIIEERRRLGIDTYDEVWDGGYHVNPYPLLEHQRLCTDLLVQVAPWLSGDRGRLMLGINIIDAAAGWDDYRCPDLVFIAEARLQRLSREGMRGEGPDAAFEIRSPGDDTYRKLPFYAALGVREVVVIDRDTKRVEVFRLDMNASPPGYAQIDVDEDGWVVALTLDVAFRGGRGDSPVVEVRDMRAAEHSARI